MEYIIVLTEGFYWDLTLFEKAEEVDFFILLLSCELDVDLPPEDCTELFII
jgi:hypothetical protein